MSDHSCPKCHSENTYPEKVLWVCLECAHEWTADQGSESPNEDTDQGPVTMVVRDANGNELKDGDSVIVLKDLKIKGSSSSIKGGTKVRNITLTDAGGGHDIACKIDGIGAVNLKSGFVRKA